MAANREWQAYQASREYAESKELYEKIVKDKKERKEAFAKKTFWYRNPMICRYCQQRIKNEEYIDAKQANKCMPGVHFGKVHEKCEMKLNYFYEPPFEDKIAFWFGEGKKKGEKLSDFEQEIIEQFCAGGDETENDFLGMETALAFQLYGEQGEIENQAPWGAAGAERAERKWELC